MESYIFLGRIIFYLLSLHKKYLLDKDAFWVEPLIQSVTSKKVLSYRKPVSQGIKKQKVVLKLMQKKGFLQLL